MSKIKIFYENGEEFEKNISSLSEIEGLIDSDLFEIIHLPDGRCIICDQDGKLKDKPINIKVTQIINDFKIQFPMNFALIDCIVGKVAILDKRVIKELG